MRERARYQISRSEIAKHVGVQEKVVQKWERGETIPSVQQFKRLIGRLPRVAPFAPTWGWAQDAVMRGEGEFEKHLEATAQEVRRMETRGEIAEKPPAEEFGPGLKRVREENEISQEELGELLGISGQSVSQWETSEVCPVIPNLDKLYTVMPELKAGIETGAIKRPPSRDMDVPVGNRYPRASTVDVAIEMAIAESDAEVKRERMAKPKKTEHADWLPECSSATGGHVFDKTDFSRHRIHYGITYGTVVCSICGVEKPDQPKPPASEIRTPRVEHNHQVRRCPCGGDLETKDAVPDGKTWVCKKCRKALFDQETIKTPLADNVSEIAAAYGRARLKLALAKQAENAAQEVLTNATTDRRNAEQEEKEALALLDLAVSEEVDKQ